MPGAEPPNSKITVSDIDKSAESVVAPAGASVDFQKLYTEFQQKFTVVSNENFVLKEEIDQLKKRIRTAETLDKLIEPYASRAYWFMVFYCLFSGIVLIYSALSVRGFHIPDGVLAILVGSTAVSVIGLVGMVLTGIFVGARSNK